ncbi:hypothetical protein JCM6882_007341 [Rhodosporidiobolus microsporus]
MSLPSPATLLLLTRRCIHCSPAATRLASTQALPPRNQPAPPPSATSPSPSPSHRGSRARAATKEEEGKKKDRVQREPRRERYPELARLGKAAHKLSFHSLPFSAPPSLLFPTPSQQPLHFFHTPPSGAWALRCFPILRRGESRRPGWAGGTRYEAGKAGGGGGRAGEGEGEEEAPAETVRTVVTSSTKEPRPRSSYALSLTLLASKKNVHKSAVVRNRCRRRVWEAMRVVVARGARATGQGKGKKVGEEGGRVRFAEGGERWAETGPRRWLLPGYHYVMTLSSLELYRAVPLEQLVEELAVGLRELKRKAERATLNLRLSELALSLSPSFSLSSSSSSPSPASAPASKLALFMDRADDVRENKEGESEGERRVRERGEGQRSWEDEVEEGEGEEGGWEVL